MLINLSLNGWIPVDFIGNKGKTDSFDGDLNAVLQINSMCANPGAVVTNLYKRASFDAVATSLYKCLSPKVISLFKPSKRDC